MPIAPLDDRPTAARLDDIERTLATLPLDEPIAAACRLALRGRRIAGDVALAARVLQRAFARLRRAERDAQEQG